MDSYNISVESSLDEDMQPKLSSLGLRVEEHAEKNINKLPAATDHESRAPSRRDGKAIPKKMLRDIDLALESISTESITETNGIIYSMATTILEEMGIRPLQARHQTISYRRMRLENTTKGMRKQVTRFFIQS